jgi:predicted amidohydrolase
MTDKNAVKNSFAVDRRTLLQGAAIATAAAVAPLSLSALADPPAPNKLRAAAINFQPVLNDNKACAARIKATIETAASDGCNLAVFPEMALQGFARCQDCKDRGNACDRHLATAELADGPVMRELAEVVKRHDMYAVIGFGERDPHKPVMYNAAAMFGPEGLIGTTRKMGIGKSGRRPFISGEDMFAQGQEITVYPTRHGPIGVGICYDMWINPEIARIMVLRGAKILAIPTATVGTTTGGDIEAMAFTRARENMVFVVNANLVRGGFESGNIGDKKLYSHSYIAGPEFPRMARILGSTDDPHGTVAAEIDLSQYDRFVERSELRKKRKADGLNAHISRIVAREYAAYIGMEAVGG